jgi:hypothetical protein
MFFTYYKGLRRSQKRCIFIFKMREKKREVTEVTPMIDKI